MTDAKFQHFWGLNITAVRGGIQISGETSHHLSGPEVDTLAAILTEAREFAFGPAGEVADG